MIRSVAAASIAFAFALSFPVSATAAPGVDAKGVCREAGKPVKAELCKPRPAPIGASKPMCRNDGGRVVACGTPGAKPAGDQSLGGALDALRAPAKR